MLSVVILSVFMLRVVALNWLHTHPKIQGGVGGLIYFQGPGRYKQGFLPINVIDRLGINGGAQYLTGENLELV